MYIPSDVCKRIAEELGCLFICRQDAAVRNVKILDKGSGSDDEYAEDTLYITNRRASVPKDFPFPLVIAKRTLILQLYSRVTDAILRDGRIAERIAALYPLIAEMDLNEAARRLGNAAEGAQVVIFDAYGHAAGVSGELPPGEAEKCAALRFQSCSDGRDTGGLEYTCVTVRCGGVNVGRAVFISQEESLTGLLLKRHAEPIGDLLSLSRKLRLHGKALTMESVVSMILDGRLSDSELIGSMVKKWGWQRRGHYFLVTAENGEAPSASMQNALREIVSTDVFIYDRYYLFILSHASSEQFMPDGELLKFLESCGMHAVMSNHFGDIAQLRGAFMQCFSVLDMRERIGAKMKFIRYQEQVAMRLVDIAATNGADLMSLCYQPILAIMAHDEKNNTRYLQTLISFLGRNMNLEKTGDALFEHRNTAYKQIKYIRETFNLDLGSFATQFKIHITVCVLYYLNLIDRKTVNSVMWDDVMY